MDGDGGFDEVLLAAAKHNTLMMSQMEPPRPLTAPKPPHGRSSGGRAGSGPASSSSSSSSAQLPQLKFESNFEGGNLRAAVQVYENEYDLFLSSDLNDRRAGRGGGGAGQGTGRL